ncbi:hypothetical protein [Kitasatospora sp. NPDC056531]|uniref:zinc finger domain-containing protein n=1 Tax=Kitasatospora sp. NPDC056531 TaxID=3345856 RepID=UPI003695A0E8
MTPIEAGQLLTHAAAFDNRKPSVAANNAWADALKDIPADPDAYAAVSRFYAKPSRDGALDSTRWIQPHHVRALRQEIRAERIPVADSIIYPAIPSETGAEYVQRRRELVTAIADGRIEPEINRQLTGGPHPTVADALAGIGQMPAHLREELAAAGLGRRTGRFPELAVACPLELCRAAPGKPCRTPSGREIKADTHGSRRDAWHAHQTTQPAA